MKNVDYEKQKREKKGNAEKSLILWAWASSIDSGATFLNPDPAIFSIYQWQGRATILIPFRCPYKGNANKTYFDSAAIRMKCTNYAKYLSKGGVNIHSHCHGVTNKCHGEISLVNKWFSPNLLFLNCRKLQWVSNFISDN